MRLIAKKRCRVIVEPPEKEPVICSSCLPRSPRGQQDAKNDSGDPSNFDVGRQINAMRLFLTAVDRQRCEWLTARLTSPIGFMGNEGADCRTMEYIIVDEMAHLLVRR